MSPHLKSMKEKKVGIEVLYKEFKSLKNYIDKLRFFDKYFDLVPFNFPSFDEHLNFLLQPEGTNLLIEILEKERRKNISFSKKEYQDKIEYVFDVTPHNSNMLVFNEYLITKFTCFNKNCSNFFFQKKTVKKADKKSLRSCADEVNDLVETITKKIENKKDRTFRKQFFNVFYSGYRDYTEEKIKKFSQKKKLIELYLYSAGILFAKYKEALFNAAYLAEPAEQVSSQIHL